MASILAADHAIFPGVAPNCALLTFFLANCQGVLADATSARQGGLVGYSNYGLDIALAATGGDEENPIATLTVLDGGLETEFAMPWAPASQCSRWRGWRRWRLQRVGIAHPC